MEEIMQLEFPFTRDGALYAYNTAQRKQMLSDYMLQLKPSDNPHYIITNKNEFIAKWIDKGNARIFAERNYDKYFGHTVEVQNPAVVLNWKVNKLFGLENRLQKEE